MVTFVGVMVVILGLATVAMIVAGTVLGIQGLTLYRHAMSVRDELMPRVSGSRDLFTRLSNRALGMKDTLEMEWRRVRPKVDVLKHDMERTAFYLKRSAETASSVMKKTKRDVKIVRAAAV